MGKHKWHRIDKFGENPSFVLLENEAGKQRGIETHRGRFERYREELKSGQYIDKNGEFQPLTAERKAYNKGFLRAYRDNAKMHSKKKDSK